MDNRRRFNWDLIHNFKKDEFDCKCNCGKNNIDDELITMLNEARILADVSFVVNSACRCDEHNHNVGGSKTSSHPKGFAVDIKVTSSINRMKILTALLKVGFKRIGIYKNFIHVDNDKSKPLNVIWYK